jgi:hypothetical protein
MDIVKLEKTIFNTSHSFMKTVYLKCVVQLAELEAVLNKIR